MSLVVVSVPRIIAAAAALDQLDPNRELKDQLSQAIRLSAVQNGTSGTVSVPDALATRVDELLADPASALPAPTSSTPDSQLTDSPTLGSVIDEHDTYDS